MRKLVCFRFTAVNVLEDNAIRQSINEFSNWPTIPSFM